VGKLGIGPVTAAFWRCQCMMLFLVPSAIIEIILVHRADRSEIRTNWIQNSLYQRTHRHVLLYVVGSGVCWAVALGGWVVSLVFTTTVRASLFGSTYPLVLVAYYRFTGTKISRGEFIGVLISLLAIVVSMITSLTHDDGARPGLDGRTMIIGDALCLVTAVFSAVDIVLSAHARKILPLVTFTTLNTAVVVVLLGIYAMAAEGLSMSDGVRRSSVWGWASADIAFLMLGFGFAVGMVGMLGFNLAIKYISPLVFSTVQLADPILTAFMSYAAGLETLPSIDTWIGGVLLVVGIVIVIRSESIRNAAAAVRRLAHSSGSGGDDDNHVRLPTSSSS